MDQTGSLSAFLLFVDWSVPFLRKGDSRDAERYGEIQNGFTS